MDIDFRRVRIARVRFTLCQHPCEIELRLRLMLSRDLLWSNTSRRYSTDWSLRPVLSTSIDTRDEFIAKPTAMALIPASPSWFTKTHTHTHTMHAHTREVGEDENIPLPLPTWKQQCLSFPSIWKELCLSFSFPFKAITKTYTITSVSISDCVLASVHNTLSVGGTANRFNPIYLFIYAFCQIHTVVCCSYFLFHIFCGQASQSYHLPTLSIAYDLVLFDNSAIMKSLCAVLQCSSFVGPKGRLKCCVTSQSTWWCTGLP